MRGDVRDALDSARSATKGNKLFYGVEPQRRLSFETVRCTVLAVITELPDDMSIAELRDELAIASNQQCGGA